MPPTVDPEFAAQAVAEVRLTLTTRGIPGYMPLPLTWCIGASVHRKENP
jgi:hypothetical protein